MTSRILVRIALGVSATLVVAGCSSAFSAGEGMTSDADAGSGGSGRVAAGPVLQPRASVPVAAKLVASSVPVATAASFGSTSTYPRPPVFRLPAVPRGQVVYLTFDDGPTRYTPQVLKLLRNNNAKATFFVIGNQVAKWKLTVARAHREGHAIENHTWSHPSLTRTTWTTFNSQVFRTNIAVKQATGAAPTCLRPPYGTYNKGTLIRANRLKMPVVLWSVDSRDWALPGTSRIVKTVLNNVRDGSIVLMHDGGGPRAQTVAAVKTLLPKLRQRGFQIRALPCN